MKDFGKIFLEVNKNTMDYKIATSSSRFSKGFNYIYNKKAFDGQMQP